MSAAKTETTGRGGRVIAVSLVAAALGGAGFAVALVVDRRQALFGWLTAFAYALSLALGALVFLMICHAMRATWPVALRRLVETVAGTLPVFAILFVPLLFGLEDLYPWVAPERLHEGPEHHLVLHKQAYLNLPFFLVRAAGYLAFWSALGWLLRRWSLQRDADPSRETGPRMRAVSAACLPAVALTLSFASFDWLMSLTPTFISTIYGVYYFAGGFVGALALITVMTRAAERAGRLPIAPSHYYALGRLLLAFTVFWAYAAYFQLMLIWIADKPIEVPFYLARGRGGFRVVSVALGIGHFVLPFFALLSYRLKRNGGRLAIVAGWLLVAHYVDVHWLIAPASGRAVIPYHWADLAALVTIGGVLVAAATWQLRGKSLVPRNDPALAAALRYESV